MKQRIFAKTAIAAALATFAFAGHALTLGEINVESNLNQRLLGVIPLAEINAEDLESVHVAVASNEEFERAGMERSDFLSSVRFALKTDGGRPRIVVTSSEIAREPVLNLMVHARWKGGTIVREYTVLLDPPSLPKSRSQAAPMLAATPAIPSMTSRMPPAASAATSPAPVIAPPRETPPPYAQNSGASGRAATSSSAFETPVEPTQDSEFFETPTEARGKPQRSAAHGAAPAARPASSASLAGSGSYGPIKPQETLWHVATVTRPGATVTMEQMMLALVDANPGTILHGITLTAGSMLRVPSASQVLTYSPREAKERLLAIQAGRKPASARAGTAAEPARAAPATGRDGSPFGSLAQSQSHVSNAATQSRPKLSDSMSPSSSSSSSPSPTAAIGGQGSPASGVGASGGTAGNAPPATSGANPSATSATSATGASTTAPVAIAPPPAQPPPPPAAVGSPPPIALTLAPDAAQSALARYYIPLLGGLAALILATALLLAARRKRAATAPASPPARQPVSSLAPRPGMRAATVSPPSPTRAGDTQVRSARALAEDHTPLPSAATSATSPPELLTLAPGDGRVPSPLAGLREGFETVRMQAPGAAKADTDPIADADFHLAYGLHDEAINVLKQGLSREPQRSDLQFKLAETYFAAGKRGEFLATAEALKNKVAPADWGKLAIMGAQLAPGSALFKGADDASVATDFNLTFDDLPAIQESVPMPSMDFGSGSAGAQQLPNLARDLDDDAPGGGKTPAGGMAAPGLQDSDSIDFMLGQSIVPLGRNLLAPAAPHLAVSQVPPSSAPAFSGGGDEFNLGATSLNVDVPPMPIGTMPGVISTTGGAVPSPEDHFEISLQSLQVSLTPREPEPASVDELNTKLDLARAYVEMGDHESARGLLKEVQDQGSEGQKSEADALLQRLPT